MSDIAVEAPFATEPTNPTEEPREWSRINRSGTHLVVPIRLIGGEPRDSLLVDNSLGGLGVHLENADGFDIGVEVSVVFNQAPLRAIIRRKQPLEDGSCQLGLQWKDD